MGQGHPPRIPTWALGLVIGTVAGASCISTRDYPGGDGDGADARPRGDMDLYHSAGYGAVELHGPDSNLQLENCRDAQCHGDDLTGGASNVSCDKAGCHKADWRTDCTFCHGGTDSPDGAPPREIDGNVDVMQMSFRAHTAHVTEQNHGVFDCSECHDKPENVLSPGHAFDDTAGRAEVNFGGLSATAQYDPDNRTCSNLYCHGDGRSPGRSAHDDAAKECSSCHGDQAAGNTAWASMSGEHSKHMRDNIGCGDCHGSVVDNASNITNKALHVNGTVDFAMQANGVDYNSNLCTGSCHGKFHFFNGW